MSKVISLLSVAIILLCSCRKEQAPGNSNPPFNEQVLSIPLNKAYMDGSKVDSAVAIWEINGQVQRIGLQLRKDTAFTASRQFHPGDGKLTVQLFSKFTIGNSYPSQWVQEKQLSMEANKSITMNGPSNFSDANWLPRVLLKDDVGHSAIVAIRPEDPYFLVKNVPANLLKLIVARDYYNGLIKVAGGEWSCTNCFGRSTDVINSDFFKFLPQQIGSGQWRHLEITILYIDDANGGGYVLSVNHIVM